MYTPDGKVKQYQPRRTKISETEWLYEAWFSAPAEYYVIETPMEGYFTIYQNLGSKAGETDQVYNGGKIVNFSVPKTGDDSRPAAWLALAGTALLALGAAAITAKRRARKDRA